MEVAMIKNVKRVVLLATALLVITAFISCHEEIEELPQSPILVSPQDGAVFSEQPPTFVWNLEPLAENYLIRVTQNSSHQAIVNDTTQDTTYTLSELLFAQLWGGTYTWAVASLCEEEGPRWSDSRSFEIDRPEPPDSVLISPQDGSVFDNQPPVFLWHSFEGANGYVLRVVRDSFMLGELLVEDTLNDTTYTMTKNMFEGAVNGNYVWAVAPIIHDDKIGWWEFRTFSIEKPLPEGPQLIQPLDGEGFESEPPTFIWLAEPLATSYWLVLYGTTTPFPDTLVSDTVADTNYTLNQKLFAESFNGDYTWKVASISTAGELIWSESRNLAFKKPLPALDLDTTYFPFGLEYEWVYESYNEGWDHYGGGEWYDTVTITVLDSTFSANGWAFELEGVYQYGDDSYAFWDVGKHVYIYGEVVAVFNKEKINLDPEPRGSYEEGFEVSYKNDTLYIASYNPSNYSYSRSSTYRLKGIGVVKQSHYESRDYGWVGWSADDRLLYFIKGQDTVWRHQE